MNNLAIENELNYQNREKAVALYRVSSKAQLGEDDDLPTQKKLVQEYIFNNGYQLCREFIEGGISAYKNTSSEREVIQSILNMARNKEFQLLVIYHSNRLGRLQDDTPQLIRELSKYKVSVVSVKEGELRAKTPIDRLMNNIRYFSNEQESVYKSEIISDYQLAMTEEGRYRGGSMIPLGYKLVDNNSKNYKGKHILDFIINQDEIEIVKLIYKLSIEMNYGQSRIARYLNEETSYKTKKGNPWHSSSIQVILNNPIYMGQFHMDSKVREKKMLSPIIRQDLVIIPTEMWYVNQELMKSRQYTKKEKDTFDKRETKNIYGKLLLNGIAYCGHCGMALTTMTAYKKWTTQDGIKHQNLYYKYRCSSFYKKGGIKCEGQSTYGTTIIEPIAIKYAKMIIKKLQQKELTEGFYDQFEKNIQVYNKQKNSLKQELEKCYDQLKNLKQEVVKSIMGESTFEKDLLNELIQQKQQEINNKTESLKDIEVRIITEKESKSKYHSLNNEFVNWEERFDNATFEVKRIMLSKIIKKFIVYGKDEFEIEYDVTINTFEENAEVKTLAMDCKDTGSVRTNCAYIQPISIYKEIVRIKLAA